MSNDICRLCNTPSTKLTASITDETIASLLDFVPHLNVDARDAKLPTSVCQLCYGKAKVSYDFLVKVQSTQNELKRAKSTRKTSNLKITSAQSLFPSEALLRMQKVGSISIRKVAAINDSIAQGEDLIEELEMLEDDHTMDTGGGGASDEDDDYDFEKDAEDDEEDEAEVYLEEDDDDDEGDDESDDNYEPANRKGGVRRQVGKSPKKGAAGSTQKQKFALDPAREIIIDAPISYSCARCRNKFSSFDELTSHMKTKNCVENELACNICTKTFRSKKNLSAHMSTHKPREKFMCDVCAKEYNHQFDLESHMESVHRRVVKSDCIYRCTHCEEKFSSHLDLLEHVKEHQREKKEAPRLCEICAKVCSNLKAYQSHIVIHKEKKAHTCIHCGKGFAKAFLMAQHMHVHTGIKAFTCEICNRSYAKRDSLRNHKKRDHPEVMM